MREGDQNLDSLRRLVFENKQRGMSCHIKTIDISDVQVADSFHVKSVVLSPYCVSLLNPEAQGHRGV
ncbi:hypothetical protein F383_30042 [Gossypium arboreum]|uniref:Uncharacterized protein n=1 Tax=Gossypium arboreum TaxID=29729 RepID=A0A0B0PJI1_GOSAR|nr:hypothetical protein F383_30042 [Gossypium arboreum]